ncbi:hypothetical protein, partial [Lentzea sp. NPDC004782]|uniref:hypothetical protein n=1 Tax=Lentzea sp. NPDC004782 TaxID=3154458 RepID=UPI0033A8E7F8
MPGKVGRYPPVLAAAPATKPIRGTSNRMGAVSGDEQHADSRFCGPSRGSDAIGHFGHARVLIFMKGAFIHLRWMK